MKWGRGVRSAGIRGILGLRGRLGVLLTKGSSTRKLAGTAIYSQAIGGAASEESRTSAREATSLDGESAAEAGSSARKQEQDTRQVRGGVDIHNSAAGFHSELRRIFY